MPIALHRTVCAALAAAALLAAAQQSTAADDAGRRVEVGGRRVHVLDEGRGTPAVVFESGMGEDVSTWARVRPAIAALTRTVAYDRAGIGASDPPGADAPRDPRRLAHELHDLLRALKVPAPYVLVGHSLGGAVVEVYAADFRAEVAGIVLVDPEDGRLIERMKAAFEPGLWAQRERALAQAMPGMPPAIRAEQQAMVERSGAQVAAALPLPYVPTVLLTGTKKNPDFPGNPLEQDLKLALHDELVARQPKIEHLLVPESRHYVQNDAPERVIEAVRSVVAQAAR